ncbi:sialate O-acetylesterase [Parabacteroides sp. Marseille-P3160]|uniref:sialate O-acetylesterase n=1 Tax=Parabacteroides sp. Marseille-P3160 TaxID=1917887 RepID=UPI0009BC3C7D|nr:sialate O-acetylesterase [Parabacteroides sp. Marseille-P3160]
MKKITLGLLLLFLLAVFSCPLSAKISLPGIFTDNMVLQQRAEAPIWGKASPGKKVTLQTSWDQRLYQVVAAKDSTWRVEVKTPDAGGPYEITISDGKKLTLRNVLIGEVWICSGQSNMEMPLAGWGKVLNYEQEIAAANYPQIRLLYVERATAVQPKEEMETRGGWQACSPATVAEFSSVAYFFGRELNKNLNIPIGLINTSWGGTIAEAWTSGKSLEQMPDFATAVQTLAEPATEKEAKNPNRPTVLYNAMIKPIIPYAIQGAIWYQGEANAGRAYQYRELFPLMIRDWRKQWKTDFPFYFVQLANYMERKTEPQESNWAELREAQLQTLSLEKTGMAVTIDIGEAKDIHPKNKQEVGRRLALAALAQTYGKAIPYSGPIYEAYRIEGNRIRIQFKQTSGALQAKGGSELQGFAIAGPDHQFHWAKATIDGDEVLVSHPDVEYPLAVRYAWGDNPLCNLYNAAGLPASPFRTDDWRNADDK